MGAILLLVVALLASGAGAGETSRAAPPRFEILAHVQPGGGYSGDVWGHRGYAYLSSHRGRGTCAARGVRVYDVRSLRRPRLVSTFADGASEPGLADSWTEKTIVTHVATPRFSGELAVTSVQACARGGLQGFALYDVTNPARPRKLAFEPTEPRGSHEIWLKAVGRKAYVYTAIIASEIRSSPDGERPGKPDFRIFDVTDPRGPVEVGGWGAWRELGIHPSEGLGPPGAANGNLVHSVITNGAGTRAFLSYWDLGTVILDISRPSQPRYLGRTDVPTGSDGNAHSASLGRGERLLVQTHETAGGVPVLYDVSRPGSPVRLSIFRLPAAALAEGRRRGGTLGTPSGVGLTDSVHDPKVVGNRAYFSWYNQGVVVADVSNPRRPRFLARFLPPPARDPDELLCPGRACTAVWGVYVGPGYLLASDLNSGLWILRVRL